MPCQLGTVLRATRIKNGCTTTMALGSECLVNDTGPGVSGHLGRMTRILGIRAFGTR